MSLLVNLTVLVLRDAFRNCEPYLTTSLYFGALYLLRA
jgi:hypothetical protein